MGSLHSNGPLARQLQSHSNYPPLDLRTEESLQQWRASQDSQKDSAFREARKLLCMCKQGNAFHPTNEFIDSHLRNFQNLEYLRLQSGTIPSHLFETGFKPTLRSLELHFCPISFPELVKVLNHFCGLAHLILDNVVTLMDKAPVPQLLHYPKELSLTGTGHGVLSELSKMHLRYKRLSLDISQDYNTAQRFIESSKERLTSLDLGDTMRSTCRNNPTICPKITDWNPWFCFRFGEIP